MTAHPGYYQFGDVLYCLIAQGFRKIERRYVRSLLFKVFECLHLHEKALKMIPRSLNPLHLLTLAVLVISFTMTTYNIHYLHMMQNQHYQNAHPETADCTLGIGPTYSVFAKVNIFFNWMVLVLRHLNQIANIHYNTLFLS